jgi:hypothetical protein
MILPKNNLPKDAQPWGRSIENAVSDLQAAHNKNEMNLNSLTSQVNTIAQNQGYAIPTIFALENEVKVEQVNISNPDIIAGMFNFRINTKGFILTLGYSCILDVTDAPTDIAYLYAEFYDVNGNLMSFYGEESQVITFPIPSAYMVGDLNLFIPLDPGVYTIVLYYSNSGAAIGKNITFKNTFAMIQPIPNSQ